MESTFDFNAFKAQHDLQTAFKELTTNLRASRDEGNARNFPDVQGQPRPFAELLQRLRIEPDEDEAPAFDFELTAVSLAQVRAHCDRTNIDFMAFTQNRGNKVYYNRTYNPNNPHWEETSRPEASDPVQELSELIFIDSANSIVDWSLSLAKLKRLGQERYYTAEMMQTALLRLVNRFMPEQTQLLEDKTANEIGTFLIQMDNKLDKPYHYRQRLFEQQRKPGEELQAALARFSNILEKVHPEANAAQAAQRENFLKTAVISFCSDTTAAHLLVEVKKATEKCRPLSYEELLRIAKAADKFEQFKPKTPLQFGRAIQSSTVTQQMQFNSIMPMLPHRKKRDDFRPFFSDHYPDYYTPPYENGGDNRPLQNPPPQAGGQAQVAQAQGGNGTGQAQQAGPQNLVQPQGQGQAMARPDFLDVTGQDNQGMNNTLRTSSPAASSSSSDYRSDNSTIGHPSPPQGHGLPTVDYAELSPTAGMIPSATGYLVVRNGENHMVINIPNEVLNRLPYSPQIGQAVTSTPHARGQQGQGGQESRYRIKTRSQERAEQAAAAAAQAAGSETGPPISLYSMQFRDNRQYSSHRDKDRRYSSDRSNRYPSRDRYHSRDRYPSRDRYQSRQRYPSKDKSYRHRDKSYDRYRSGSRDRDRYRSKSRDSRRDYSSARDRRSYRSPSRDKSRYRSQSRDRRHFRSQSRDRKYNRPQSRDRKSYRSQSRDKRHHRSSHGKDRSQSRDKNRYRSQSRDRDSHRQSDKRDKSSYERRDYKSGNSRSRSRDRHSSYPDMRRGENCGSDYDPRKMMMCRKCSASKSHHEFACYRYKLYNKDLCSACKQYHHFSSDCQELPRFPPKANGKN